MPRGFGALQCDRSDDKQDHSGQEHDYKHGEQQMEQPHDQAKAQREDQRKRYRDNMREQTYPPTGWLISIPHQRWLLRTSGVMLCILSCILFIFGYIFATKNRPNENLHSINYTDEPTCGCI